MARWPVSVLLVLVASAAGALDSDSESIMNAEIDFLLQRVAESNCVFIRNGTEHDAEAAVDHLAMKRRRGRRHYDTADEFIERIASKSSWTGTAYQIRCGDEEQTAEAWFTTRLNEYRRNNPAADDGE